MISIATSDRRSRRASFTHRLIRLWSALLLGAFVLPSALSAQEWESIQRSDLRGIFMRDVAFTDPDNGHAVGWLSGTQSAVLRTTNGGETWVVQGLNDAMLFASKFLDGDHGVIAGNGAACDCGVILATTDGGDTWGPTAATETSGFNVVATADENTVFVGGDDGVLYRSTDKGRTWSVVETGETGSFQSLTFINATTGYASMSPGTFGRATILAKTTNGGTSWTALLETEEGRNFGGSYFIDEQNGFLTGSVDDYQAVLATTDGGDTWTTAWKGSIAERVLHDVVMVNERIGFAVGEEGTIVATTDGGRSWETEAYSTSSLYSIQYIGDRVITVGDFGTIAARTVSTATAEANLSVSELDFETVDVGTGKTLGVTVTPKTSVPLTVTGARIEGGTGVFTIVAPGTDAYPNLLPTPSWELTIEVEYTPAAVGEHTATLVIETNVGEYEVPLVGTAAPVSSVISSDGVRGLELTLLPSVVRERGEIALTAPAASQADVALYDLLGRKVASLYSGRTTGSTLTLTYGTENLTPGIYYCVAQVGAERVVRKTVIDR